MCYRLFELDHFFLIDLSKMSKLISMVMIPPIVMGKSMIKEFGQEIFLDSNSNLGK